jgi:hypothetical protein
LTPSPNLFRVKLGGYRIYLSYKGIHTLQDTGPHISSVSFQEAVFCCSNVFLEGALVRKQGVFVKKQRKDLVYLQYLSQEAVCSVVPKGSWREFLSENKEVESESKE